MFIWYIENIVYDKLHDSLHPDAQKLDKLYEKVVAGMKALECFYILHEYIGLSDDYKYDLYDYLNDEYEEYIDVFYKTEILESSDSYYTATSGSSDTSETSD